MTKKDIEDEIVDYIEQGYMSEDIEESDGFEKINSTISDLYSNLTPKRRDGLGLDLDHIQANIEEYISDIADTIMFGIKKRLEEDLQEQLNVEPGDNGYSISPAYLFDKPLSFPNS